MKAKFLTAFLVLQLLATPIYAQEEEEEGTFTDWVLSGVYDALKEFWCWLVNWAMDWLDWFFEMIKPGLPDLGEYWDVIGPYLGYANHWLPIDTALTVGAGLILIRVVLIAVRWIVAFIPTLG